MKEKKELNDNLAIKTTITTKQFVYLTLMMNRKRRKKQKIPLRVYLYLILASELTTILISILFIIPRFCVSIFKVWFSNTNLFLTKAAHTPHTYTFGPSLHALIKQKTIIWWTINHLKISYKILVFKLNV